SVLRPEVTAGQNRDAERVKIARADEISQWPAIALARSIALRFYAASPTITRNQSHDSIACSAHVWRSKPVSMVRRLYRLRANKPAPVSSRSDKATCTLTRSFPSGRRVRPHHDPRSLQFRRDADARRLQRRRQSEQDAGQDRNHERKA